MYDVTLVFLLRNVGQCTVLFMMLLCNFLYSDSSDQAVISAADIRVRGKRLHIPIVHCDGVSFTDYHVVSSVPQSPRGT